MPNRLMTVHFLFDRCDSGPSTTTFTLYTDTPGDLSMSSPEWAIDFEAATHQPKLAQSKPQRVRIKQSLNPVAQYFGNA